MPLTHPKVYCLLVANIFKPVKFAGPARPGVRHCCNCTHTMVAVTSDGEVMPCSQMSGFFLKDQISLGNVRETPLAELLGDGAYTRTANMTVGDLAGSACATCEHLDYCGGGCRALGLLFSGRRDLSGLTCRDVTKCRYFEGGWYEKIVRSLPGWTNLSQIGS
ncbi:SPASM domain-containing protein [Olsenella intestinalis]|uniref:SPASM domain-containing protein n=1 Tax=Olsenella intestinalis TaxID=2930083 RepID=UPI00200F1FD0|nr:SPASM domain-containing protein [Olsenella intestinalis]